MRETSWIQEKSWLPRSNFCITRHILRHGNLCSIDFEKVFYNISRSMRFSDVMVRTLSTSYWLCIETHSGELSSILFLLVNQYFMEDVFREADVEIVWSENKELTDLENTDEIALICKIPNEVKMDTKPV